MSEQDKKEQNKNEKKKCCGKQKCDKDELIPSDVHMVESKESLERTKAELKANEVSKAKTISKEEQNETVEQLLGKRSS